MYTLLPIATITTVTSISDSTTLLTTTPSTKLIPVNGHVNPNTFLLILLFFTDATVDVHAKEAPAIVTVFGRESGDVPPLSDLNIGVVNRLLYLQVRPLEYLQVRPLEYYYYY